MTSTSSRAAWSQGTEQLADDVYRCPLPLPNDALRAINVYIVLGPDGVSVIDGGWALAESEAVFEHALREIGVGFKDVTGFYVTHFHRDHYTQAAVLRSKWGMKVALGLKERPNLEGLVEAVRSGGPLDGFADTLHRAGASTLATQWLRHRPDPVDLAHYAGPDRWLADAEPVVAGARELTVIETPGHTSGHVVYHDRANRMLFAGDHVLPQITPSIALEQTPGELPLRDFLRSLTAMLELPDGRLLPAHGPVTDSVHDRAKELIDHHGARFEEMVEAVGGGAATGVQVANAVRWTRRRHRLTDLDLFNSTLAVCETMAHLDVLVADGRLDRTSAPGGPQTFALPQGRGE